MLVFDSLHMGRQPCKCNGGYCWLSTLCLLLLLLFVLLLLVSAIRWILQ